MFPESLIIVFMILVPPSATEQEDVTEDRNTTLEHPAPRSGLDEFTELLPAEGLDGWTTVGGQARFVREGDLLRGLDSGSRNTFLMSDRSFGDFILEGEVKIEGRAVWSCLVFAASECKKLDLCVAFFEKLRKYYPEHPFSELNL